MYEYFLNALSWLGDNAIDVIQALSVIVASYVAVKGINTWKREIIGKKKFELAEEVLCLFYECRSHMEYIRTPCGISIDEGATRKKIHNETPEQEEILNQSYIPIERYQEVQKTFDKLFSLKYRYGIYFNDQSAEIFRELEDIVRKVKNASYNWGRCRLKVAEKENSDKKVWDEIDKYERVFQKKESGDEIGSEINEIIMRVEKACKKIITKPQ